MSGYAASTRIDRARVRARLAPAPTRAWAGRTGHAAAPERFASDDVPARFATTAASATVTPVAIDLVASEPGRLARLREDVLLGWRQTTFFLFSAEGWR